MDEQDTEVTRVIFRVLEGEVIAIFPDDPGTNDWWTCCSYMHAGQHASTDKGIVQFTKLATPEQYQPLYEELEKQIGYKLKVMKKWPPTSDDIRRKLIARVL